MTIDWDDPKSHISPHFTVEEALLLPSWMVMHKPTYTEKANIQVIAGKIEDIRAIFDRPIHVHCWIRPEFANCDSPTYHGHNYNSFVGGAPDSMHIHGRAVDFHVDGYEGSVGCAEVRATLLPHLEVLGLRMENKSGPWVHVDNKPVSAGGRRFFQP